MPNSPSGRNGNLDQTDWFALLPFKKVYNKFTHAPPFRWTVSPPVLPQPDMCSVAEQNILSNLFAEKLARYLERIGHSQGWYQFLEPDDALEELVIVFLWKWTNFDPDRSNGSLTAYWQTTLYRVMCSHLRSRKKELDLRRGFDVAVIEIGDEREHEPVEDAQSAELFDKVHETLDELSERHRTIIVMRIFDELPDEHIARKLEIKKDAARQLFIRALNSFKMKYRSITACSAVPEHEQGK